MSNMNNLNPLSSNFICQQDKYTFNHYLNIYDIKSKFKAQIESEDINTNWITINKYFELKNTSESIDELQNLVKPWINHPEEVNIEEPTTGIEFEDLQKIKIFVFFHFSKSL